ncbi:MAG: hypothetical protein H7Y89_10460 [Steroidobacteraceae bacterium]|nr:hypothetical protein [Steroidobacteraceae bacterium]
MRGSRALSIACIAPALLLAGCATFDPARYETVVVPESAIATWHGVPVREGQIAVIERPSATSVLLSFVAQRYEPFIHAGLVVFDDGEPYVYEAMGVFKPHLTGRPTRGMGGGVRRVKLAAFLARDGIVALYEPEAGVDRAAAAAFARTNRAARTPFDDTFDARDARRFYCVEFVARALEAGGAAPVAGVELSSNRSMRVVLDWLEIHSPTILLAGELLEENRRVLLAERRRTRAQIEAYFERKRELHRRFTADQRLGNVLDWRGLTLKLRPRVREFLDLDRAVGSEARVFAAEVFGDSGSDRVAQGIQVGVPSSN